MFVLALFAIVCLIAWPFMSRSCHVISDLQIPLNIDGHRWIFKKPTSASADMALLMTHVNGKVFELQNKLKNQKEQKKTQQDPVKMLAAEESGKAERSSTPKAQAKGKAKAKGGSKGFEEVTYDEGKTDREVSVHGSHGTVLTRDKYFVDCLVMAIRSAIRTARMRFAEKDEIPVQQDEQLVYTESEVLILRECIRHGMYFCYSGGKYVWKKVYKKWTTMRPALQGHALRLCEQACVFCVQI